MITVQRRWFVSTEKIEDFGLRWVSEIMPDLIRQPGFIRAEGYESDVRGHWITSVSWQDEQSRSKAAEHFAEVFQTARVDAALAASVFHSGEIAIPGLKRALHSAGIEVRL